MTVLCQLEKPFHFLNAEVFNLQLKKNKFFYRLYEDI